MRIVHPVEIQERNQRKIGVQNSSQMSNIDGMNQEGSADELRTGG